MLLEPLFIHQEAGLYPNKYSIHDLLSRMQLVIQKVFFVLAVLISGNDEYMPVEECGNMIFMALAYSQFTDNTHYLKKHYRILKQWTSYLVDFGLIPATQGISS
jgi:ubiquinone/menaquinone biosynthesis C-methylase UbiE